MQRTGNNNIIQLRKANGVQSIKNIFCLYQALLIISVMVNGLQTIQTALPECLLLNTTMWLVECLPGVSETDFVSQVKTEASSGGEQPARDTLDAGKHKGLSIARKKEVYK